MSDLLNPYEKQLVEAEKENIRVFEKPFRTYDGRIKGNRVFIRKGMPIIRSACVLSEERGHFHTCSSDILDQNDSNSRRLEEKGRRWSYDDMVGLFGIVKAYKRKCYSLYDMAKELDVSEDYLNDAICSYRAKYGTGVKYDEYFISFEPQLTVCEFKDMNFFQQTI